MGVNGEQAELVADATARPPETGLKDRTPDVAGDGVSAADGAVTQPAQDVHAEPTAQAEQPLAPAQSARLSALETVIRNAERTFVKVGKALMEIRDSRLYRQTHATFKEYCRDRWNMSRSFAHRLIESAEVAQILLPIGNIPATESQARPLTSLAPDQMREAWTHATDTAMAAGRPVTARDVQTAVDGVRCKPTQEAGQSSEQSATTMAEPEAAAPPSAPQATPVLDDDEQVPSQPEHGELPCPFCGSSDTHLDSAIGTLRQGYRVVCRDCNAAGPSRVLFPGRKPSPLELAALREQAVELWNGALRPAPEGTNATNHPPTDADAARYRGQLWAVAKAKPPTHWPIIANAMQATAIRLRDAATQADCAEGEAAP